MLKSSYSIRDSNIKINWLVSLTGRTPKTYPVKVPFGDSGSSPGPTYIGSNRLSAIKLRSTQRGRWVLVSHLEPIFGEVGVNKC